MAGTDTVRGIHYQAIRSVVTALDCLDDPDFTAIRVEGVEDLYDVEVIGKDGVLLLVQQIKTRGADYAWTKADVQDLLSRWADLKPHSRTRFHPHLVSGNVAVDGVVGFPAVQLRVDSKSIPLPSPSPVACDRVSVSFHVYHESPKSAVK